MYQLLIVDDDRDILSVNEKYFSKIGFQVYTATNEKEALEAAYGHMLNCIVLDIFFPDTNGYEILSKLRIHTDAPVIFLSNSEDEDSRINGFIAGGDDYVTKPYSLRELELRIYARIRQREGKAPPIKVLRFGRLAINIDMRTVYMGENMIPFTPMEFNILQLLAESPKAILSTEDVYKQAWQAPVIASDYHTVQVHIAQVRRKLDTACPEHTYIQTVRSKGYQFMP